MKKNVGAALFAIVLLLCMLCASAQADCLVTNGGVSLDNASLPHNTEDAAAPKVYFLSDISPEALVMIYEALGVQLPGKVGVKMSTGESTRSNYLRPELIADLIHLVNGTIVECNTAYGGSRASTAMHRQQAKDNGLLDVAELDILDEEGSMEIPIEGGVRIPVDYVGSHFGNYDSFLVLTHFKGHAMAGFGGAIWPPPIPWPLIRRPSTWYMPCRTAKAFAAALSVRTACIPWTWVSGTGWAVGIIS